MAGLVDKRRYGALDDREREVLISQVNRNSWSSPKNIRGHFSCLKTSWNTSSHTKVFFAKVQVNEEREKTA